jgi:hypothetical protein
MKKILILILLLSATHFAGSQSTEGYGFKGGISLPFVTLDYNSNPSPAYTVKIDAQNKIGLSAGIFADVYRANRFLLSSEMYYDQVFVNLRYTEDYNSGGIVNQYSSDYKIDYLAFGLIARLDFGKNNFLPYAFTGIRFGFYLSDNFTNTSQEFPTGLLLRVSDNLKRLLPSVACGVGAEIRTSDKVSVFGEASFSPGILRMFEFSGISASTNPIAFKTGLRIYY